MKMFLVVEHSRGEGCDYTIGCGVRVTQFEAVSKEAVFEMLKQATLVPDEVIYKPGFSAGSEELTKKLRFYWDRFHDITSDGDRARSSVIVYEIESMEAVPLSMWRAEIAEGKKAAQVEAREAEERAQLAKLKSKYEKG